MKSTGTLVLVVGAVSILVNGLSIWTVWKGEWRSEDWLAIVLILASNAGLLGICLRLFLVYLEEQIEEGK